MKNLIYITRIVFNSIWQRRKLMLNYILNADHAENLLKWPHGESDEKKRADYAGQMETTTTNIMMKPRGKLLEGKNSINSMLTGAYFFPMVTLRTNFIHWFLLFCAMICYFRDFMLLFAICEFLQIINSSF